MAKPQQGLKKEYGRRGVNKEAEVGRKTRWRRGRNGEGGELKLVVEGNYLQSERGVTVVRRGTERPI